MSIPKQDHQATFFDATFLAQDLFDQKDRYDIFTLFLASWALTPATKNPFSFKY
jgi:hypothetical protein